MSFAQEGGRGGRSWKRVVSHSAHFGNSVYMANVHSSSRSIISILTLNEASVHPRVSIYPLPRNEREHNEISTILCDKLTKHPGVMNQRSLLFNDFSFIRVSMEIGSDFIAGDPSDFFDVGIFKSPIICSLMS
jgi:hypothetical protein